MNKNSIYSSILVLSTVCTPSHLYSMASEEQDVRCAQEHIQDLRTLDQKLFDCAQSVQSSQPDAMITVNLVSSPGELPVHRTQVSPDVVLGIANAMNALIVSHESTVYSVARDEKILNIKGVVKARRPWLNDEQLNEVAAACYADKTLYQHLIKEKIRSPLSPHHPVFGEPIELWEVGHPSKEILWLNNQKEPTGSPADSDLD